MDYYSFTDQDGWKTELARLVDPQRTQSGHMSTVEQALTRESPPAKDRHPNHRDMPLD